MALVKLVFASSPSRVANIATSPARVATSLAASDRCHTGEPRRRLICAGRVGRFPLPRAIQDEAVLSMANADCASLPHLALKSLAKSIRPMLKNALVLCHAIFLPPASSSRVRLGAIDTPAGRALGVLRLAPRPRAVRPRLTLCHRQRCRGWEGPPSALAS